MKKAKLLRADFQIPLESLKSQFDESIQLFEQRDYSGSVDKAKQVRAGLSDILEKLIGDYEHSLKDRFHDIDQLLGKFESGDFDEKRVGDFTSDLVQLDKYLRWTNREIKRNYPVRSMWIAFLTENKKILAIGAAVVIATLFVFGCIRIYQAKRKGLLGTYYSDKLFLKVYCMCVDNKVHFFWDKKFLFYNWKKDNFSVRWTGYIRIPEEGIYEFYTQSDDGVALWVGGQNIISNWTRHGATIDKGTLSLKAGYYAVRLEYFEEKFRATIHLSWRKNGDPKPTIISPQFLIPSKEYLKTDIPLIAE
jgi:hypothetical protein